MNLTFDVAGIAALLLAILTIYKALTSRKTDSKKGQADLATIFESLATKTAVRNGELTERLGKTECEMRNLREDLVRILSLLVDWKYGIDRLIAQIREQGDVPVWEPQKKDLDFVVSFMEKE